MIYDILKIILEFAFFDTTCWFHLLKINKFFYNEWKKHKFVIEYHKKNRCNIIERSIKKDNTFWIEKLLNEKDIGKSFWLYHTQYAIMFNAIQCIEIIRKSYKWDYIYRKIIVGINIYIRDSDTQPNENTILYLFTILKSEKHTQMLLKYTILYEYNSLFKQMFFKHENFNTSEYLLRKSIKWYNIPIIYLLINHLDKNCSNSSIPVDICFLKRNELNYLFTTNYWLNKKDKNSFYEYAMNIKQKYNDSDSEYINYLKEKCNDFIQCYQEKCNDFLLCYQEKYMFK